MEAAVEFQKILDHRGVVVSDPIGALATLELSRAYRLSGEDARSASCFHAFLALWKDADLDIPIFSQAKSESAKLR